MPCHSPCNLLHCSENKDLGDVTTLKSIDCVPNLKRLSGAAPRSSPDEKVFTMCRILRSQSEVQPSAVVLDEPLLKRALSRREKHEVLFGAAVLALGSDRALKQQPVISLTSSTILAFPRKT